MNSPNCVLEVGAGTQELEKHLNCDYVSCDFEPGFKPDVVGDAHNLPFKDYAFDTVVTKNCLQHVKDWKRALSEMMRVARKRIVLAERTHEKPTEVVFIGENDLIRRRFNREDLINVLKGWGEVSFRLSGADDRVGIYLGEVN